MPVLSVLNPISPSATMEQAPLHYCCDCKNLKAQDQFALRTRNNKYGARGKPSSRCSACAAKERIRWETRKRKRDEENPDPSGDQVGRDPIISIEEFAASLHEQALMGNIHYSTCVSTQLLAGENNEVCAGILGRVWESTGFRFTYDRLSLEGQ